MPIPNNPVTLTPQQVDELYKKLAKMRHDINNHLSLIGFAVEILRTKTDMVERMIGTISDQSPKIQADLAKYTAEFEQALGMQEAVIPQL
ncbi:MAG: hypothetical protein ABI042_02130 [Verrucomicrobiota bacterium]